MQSGTEDECQVSRKVQSQKRRRHVYHGNEDRTITWPPIHHSGFYRWTSKTSFYASVARQCRQTHYAFRLSRCPVCSSGQILLPRYLMNGLNNCEKNWQRIFSSSYLIRFWRSKVTGRGYSRSMWWRVIQDDAGASKSIFYISFGLTITMSPKK